jgi:hypothetical protein
MSKHGSPPPRRVVAPEESHAEHAEHRISAARDFVPDQPVTGWRNDAERRHGGQPEAARCPPAPGSSLRFAEPHRPAGDGKGGERQRQAGDEEQVVVETRPDEKNHGGEQGRRRRFGEVRHQVPHVIPAGRRPREQWPCRKVGSVKPVTARAGGRTGTAATGPTRSAGLRGRAARAPRGASGRASRDG